MYNRYLVRRTRQEDGASRSRMMRDNRSYPYEDTRDYSRGYADGYSAASNKNDYAMNDGVEKEYMYELMNWINKLRNKENRFRLSKEDVINKAKEMGVQFRDYSEEEFYAIYLAMATDFKKVGNDPHTYINMAKEFLEDDDIAVSPSEKVCIYLYEIVLGK